MRRSEVDILLARQGDDVTSKLDLEAETTRADLHANNRQRLENAVCSYKKLSKHPRRSIQTKLALDISKALMLYTRFVHVDPIDDSCIIFDSNRELDGLLVDEAKVLLKHWRLSVRKGDRIECQDWVDEFEHNDEERGWIKSYKGVVERHAPGGTTIYKTDENGNDTELVLFQLKEDHPGALFVHFDGFTDDDKWVQLTEDHVMPEGTREETVAALELFNKEQLKKRKRTVENELISTSNQLLTKKKKKTIISRSEDKSIITAPGNGSKSHELVNTDTLISCNDKIPNGVKENGTTVSAQPATQSASTTKSKKIPVNRPKIVIIKAKAKKKKTKKQCEDCPALICVECTEAECSDDPLSPLIQCSGECLRSFHYPCAGLDSIPNRDNKWICLDCTNKRHKCAICKEYGDDKKEVFPCSQDDCGLFYHMNCLATFGIEADIIEDLDFIDDIAEFKESPHLDHELTFKCPAHDCMVCNEGDPLIAAFQRKGGGLVVSICPCIIVFEDLT